MINSIGKESSLTESNHKIECQVYDDLSTFMQIFKKLLIAIEELTLSRLKELPRDNIKEKFKDLSQTMKPLLSKYPFGSVINLHQERTFYRFICRIHQSLALYQIKYLQASSLDGQFISHTLSDIKEVIKKNQSPQKFPELIRRIQIIIDKFLRMQIEQQVKKSISPQKFGIKKINILQKMDIKLIKIKGNQLAKQGNERFSYLSNESEEQQINDDQKQQTVPSFDNLSYCKSTKFLYPSSYENDLQNRFQLFKGLDLNYQSFKTSYIQAKSRGDEFYESCLERNTIISRIMKTYRDDFQLFQKRRGIKRQKRQLRQERMNLSLQKKNSHTVERFPNHPAQSQRVNPQTGYKLKTNNVTFIHNESNDHLDADAQQLQNKKQSYRMNNVYMTFGKPILKGYKLPQKYPFITPSIIRKKNQLQSISFNSSVHPSNDYTIVKSIDIRHANLKIVSQMKASQRMKTNPDQQTPIQNSLQKSDIKHLMRSYKEAMPIRGITKKRYLQLDCTNSKEISLNKIILTGNNKNIKLNKINQQKVKTLFL